MVVGSRDEARVSTCATAPSGVPTPMRVAASSRSMKSKTSLIASWWALAMIACVPASATPHRTLADFGIENEKSKPATAFCFVVP